MKLSKARQRTPKRRPASSDAPRQKPAYRDTSPVHQSHVSAFSAPPSPQMPSRVRQPGQNIDWSSLEFFESGSLASGVSDSAKDKVLRAMDLTGEACYDLGALSAEVDTQIKEMQKAGMQQRALGGARRRSLVARRSIGAHAPPLLPPPQR
jgi:hypothetical protein